MKHDPTTRIEADHASDIDDAPAAIPALNYRDEIDSFRDQRRLGWHVVPLGQPVEAQ
jgi:hypothetical protein